jgi:hypothetical protein
MWVQMKNSYVKILKKPETAQTFVWEPIEGFKLEPKFRLT